MASGGDKEPAAKSSSIDKYGFKIEFDDHKKATTLSSSSSGSLDEQQSQDIWHEILCNWRNWMERRPTKVRARCCEGIPHKMRGRVWFKLCGADKLMESNDGLYEKLISQPDDDDNHNMKCIKLDIGRFFRNHVLFFDKDGQGQRDLKSVLKAYILYDKASSDYTGALGMIASFLLIHMPPKNAFWCLVAITGQFIPGYFIPNMDKLMIDMKIFNSVLLKVTPSVARFYKAYDIDCSVFAMLWFQTAFISSSLPWESILRVFDLFLFEGRITLFRVSLAVCSATFNHRHSIQTENNDLVIQIFLALKDPPPELLVQLQPDTLIAKATQYSVRVKDLDKETAEMTKQYYKEQEESKQHQIKIK